MFIFFLLSLFLVPSQQQSVIEVMLRPHRTLRNSAAVELYKLRRFKGIPEFAELAADEKRELYHYEQTIVVRDSGRDDDKVRRCEVMEVYQEDQAKEVLQTLSKTLNLKAEEVLMERMMKLMNDCDSVDDTHIPDDPKGIFEEDSDTQSEERMPNPILNGIVPGTKWCGFGDIAESYHDLAGLRNVDRCCRAHDLCPVKVLSKDTRYNLTNEAKYTKTNCICDEAFYDCLKKDNGWSAKLIGNLYFYAAAPQCIRGLPEFPEEGMEFIPATKKW